MTYIRTERLLLRAPEMGDLDALHGVFSHRQAMQYWSRSAHKTKADTQKTLNGMIHSYGQTGAEYVIELDGHVIGKAGFWRAWEIGYILHPDFWRQGIAFEALRAILKAVFAQNSDLMTVTAEIDPRNIGSCNLLIKLDFVQTHTANNTIEVNGEWCGSAYFALNAPNPE